MNRATAKAPPPAGMQDSLQVDGKLLREIGLDEVATKVIDRLSRMRNETYQPLRDGNGDRLGELERLLDDATPLGRKAVLRHIAYAVVDTWERQEKQRLLMERLSERKVAVSSGLEGIIHAMCAWLHDYQGRIDSTLEIVRNPQGRSGSSTLTVRRKAPTLDERQQGMVEESAAKWRDASAFEALVASLRRIRQDGHVRYVFHAQKANDTLATQFGDSGFGKRVKPYETKLRTAPEPGGERAVRPARAPARHGKAKPKPGMQDPRKHKQAVPVKLPAKAQLEQPRRDRMPRPARMASGSKEGARGAMLPTTADVGTRRT